MKTKWLTLVISGLILLLAVSLASCTTTATTTTGDIQGSLIGADTAEPLAGATIILGLVTGESECTLQSDLIAFVGEDGTSALTDVPAGIYVVFYDLSEEAEGTLQEIDGLEIDYALIGEPPGGTSSFITNELYDTLGGGDILMQHYEAGANLTIEDGVIASIEGSFALTSFRYGLTMEFHDGEPITVEVESGETANLDIMAIVTEWPW
ncbi:MAG TPA: hypothetical protein G4N91_02760 [Dehalococcoidia bacterium]|nr:hypothetical protein [Dehalococcoidia bacterium]